MKKMILEPRKLKNMCTALKKKGYLKSTFAKAALFKSVTPMLFMVHNINHMDAVLSCIRLIVVDSI